MNILWLLLAWYIPPMLAVIVMAWWETDLLCGDEWTRRCDVRFIAACIVTAALWPLFAFFVFKRTYLYLRYMKFFATARQSRDLWMGKYIDLKTRVEEERWERNDRGGES